MSASVNDKVKGGRLDDREIAAYERMNERPET